ncbi:cell division protein ZapE [Legionella nagasakiensis]|uniref:cell division protein ZapE n=1 Tax=Legionella nagasakiensis TaxID=535290 RepID=UPI0010562DA0|nr:cell division protein ZapE [Legionella nagasakiensis]
MTLIEQYNSALACGAITDDPVQRQMLEHFQRLVDELHAAKRSWFRYGKKKTWQGIYLYGPVGGGKTYLMDLFYQGVGIQQKSRFHFHHFMQQVDAQLRRLQGHQDPLRNIAANLAKSTRLLCLDEFFVHDIADAMILAELLQALFNHGVILVATSNTEPDNLYLNGLQRVRFLPAIELIKSHCQVLALPENRDYRLGRALLPETYLFPLNDLTNQKLHRQFDATSTKIVSEGKLTIQNRFIPFVKCSEHAVWFVFNVICNSPRSQLDYLEIAERFDVVFISEIPKLARDDTVRAILLIHFIDVMYDKGVRVIFSAAVPAEQLYTEGAVRHDFQRTLSRLEEMQSSDYLSRHARREVATF